MTIESPAQGIQFILEQYQIWLGKMLVEHGRQEG